MTDPAWYLDPLVARQKHDVHVSLIRPWIPLHAGVRILKTDLFEEAYGQDHFLFDLATPASRTYALDVAPTTVRTALTRHRASRLSGVCADLCALPFRTGSFDIVISNSTLDHLPDRTQFLRALNEMHRVLCPGGLWVITLDNPWNPMYALLRRLSHLSGAPFVLKYTESMRRLERDLRDCDVQLLKKDWLVHNPRIVSTLLFLGLRKMLRGRASAPIAAFLWLFDLFRFLPTRGLTSCWVAIVARKRRDAGQNR